MRKQDIVVFVNDHPKMPRGIQVEVEIPEGVMEGTDEDEFLDRWVKDSISWDRLSDLVPGDNP